MKQHNSIHTVTGNNVTIPAVQLMVLATPVKKCTPNLYLKSYSWLIQGLIYIKFDTYNILADLTRDNLSFLETTL